MEYQQMSALYVGDLHPDVTEAMLYEKFSLVGQVLSLRVCRDVVSRRSLSYAYVNYQQRIDAETAMDTMNFDAIRGKPMRIMWSQRDPSLRKSGVGNLFIKNLDRSIDNRSLYDTFSAFGTILSCKVVMDEDGISKGYGFIHYEELEAANLAIEKVNGMLLNQKKVYVGNFIPHKEREKMISVKPKDYCNLYVKNLPDISEEKLTELFAQFGNIASCAVMRHADGTSKGFGFVSFDSRAAAEDAIAKLHGFEVDGQQIYVAKAQKKAARQLLLKRLFENERNEQQQGVNLFLKNLEDSVDESVLRKEFAPFGSITSVKVMTEEGRSKGFGFVCFSVPEEANKAITEMHGKMMGAKPIYVALAQRKEDRKAMITAHLQRISIQPNSYPTAPHLLLPAVAQTPRFFTVNHVRSSPRWLAANTMRPNGPYPTISPNMMRLNGGPRSQSMPQNHRNAFSSRANSAVATPRSGKNDRYVNSIVPHLGNGGDICHLNASMLAAVSQEDQSQILGAKLYPQVEKICPSMAGKITGMLLEIDIPEVLRLVEDHDALRAKVEEAIIVLRAHHHMEQRQKKPKQVVKQQQQPQELLVNDEE